MGKPWILPGVLARSIVITIIAVAVAWLEQYFGIAYESVLNVQIIYWTGLVIFIAWVTSLTHLLLLRASNTYILRNDSLDIRFGILTSKSFVLAPSGFSDLEVIRTVSARIVGIGDIIVRTQGERDVKMVMVRSPLKVADQIREVMARPIVRLEEQKPDEEEK
jgi:uncharacterized membrane protein YdbT with pleckstrin-like domain